MDERLQSPPKKIEKTQEQKDLERAFKDVAATEEGRMVLFHLMTLCGYKEPSMVLNPVTNEILTNTSMWNESKRGVWLDIRKKIPPKSLNVIEMER